MRTLCFTTCLLSAESLAFCQLESDTITIQATRPMSFQTLQPDQVVFNVTVNSPLNAGLDDVLAAVQSSGITSANFSNLSNSGDNRAPLQWWFSLTVPIAKWKATVTLLTALQQSINKNNSGMQLSFGVQILRSSTASSQAQSCSPADLVADAQAQAQKVAAAAGLFVGQIVAISDQSSLPALTIAPYAERVGAFSLNVWYSTPAMPNCVAEVKFKLLRYQ